LGWPHHTFRGHAGFFLLYAKTRFARANGSKLPLGAIHQGRFLQSCPARDQITEVQKIIQNDANLRGCFTD
jgi:hypothetical protein